MHPGCLAVRTTYCLARADGGTAFGHPVGFRGERLAVLKEDPPDLVDPERCPVGVGEGQLCRLSAVERSLEERRPCPQDLIWSEGGHQKLPTGGQHEARRKRPRCVVTSFGTSQASRVPNAE